MIVEGEERQKLKNKKNLKKVLTDNHLHCIIKYKIKEGSNEYEENSYNRRGSKSSI